MWEASGRNEPSVRPRNPAQRWLPAGGLFILIAIALFVRALGGSSPVSAHSLPGAIFTTLPDGSAVNGNIYSAKCDVALNGGPASPGSHHLPDGAYDVAVTDPSGKTALGVGATAVAISADEGTFGPISLCSLVIPSPYETTPNHGGEYKAWLCLTGQLFVNDDCKTDNFKVRPITASPTPSPAPAPTPTPTATPTNPPTPSPTLVLSSTATPGPVASPSATPQSSPAPGSPTPTPAVLGATATPQPSPTAAAKATATPVVLSVQSSPAPVVGRFPNSGSNGLNDNQSAIIALAALGLIAISLGLTATRARKPR